MTEPRVLRELLLDTKDGDWGAEAPRDGLVKLRVVRGTDFQSLALGDPTSVPTRYITMASANRRTLRLNDILLETAGGSRDRPTGRTMLVTQRVMSALGGPATCASFARFLRPDPDKVDAEFLFWYLRCGYATGEMASFQVQHTGVARFHYTTFAATFKLELPNRATQRAIAEVLGALDDKIAANALVIRQTDRLRRLLYEEMLDSHELPLSELAGFVNGRAFTKDASGTGRVVIRIAELNSGIGGSTVYNDIDVPDENLARAGDLLFAWSGTLTAHRWFRPEGIVNQHIFKVIPKTGWPLWLVACALDRKLDDFKAIAADKATTMGHIQRRHLDEPVPVPTLQVIHAHNAAMSALWSRALAAEIESEQLATLRDTLLPHLMSGRLTVRDAEARVEAAL